MVIACNRLLQGCYKVVAALPPPCYIVSCMVALREDSSLEWCHVVSQLNLAVLFIESLSSK